MENSIQALIDSAASSLKPNILFTNILPGHIYALGKYQEEASCWPKGFRDDFAKAIAKVGKLPKKQRQALETVIQFVMDFADADNEQCMETVILTAQEDQDEFRKKYYPGTQEDKK